MAQETPAWGIEPVPERLRVLGLADTTLLWGSLGVSLLVLVAGALLVPALSLRDAFGAIVIGGAIGSAMLGLAGMIGAQARVPAMVLMRAPLGRNGSYLPTALNVLQNVGWATFELIVIGTAAAALSDEVLGFEARWAWTLLFGALAAWLALMGPVGVVRRFLKRFAVWIVLASLVYLTWWAVSDASLGDLWSQPGEGGLSLWQGADLVVALVVSWIPLAADYTRFTRTERAALVGTGVGYFVAGVWLFGLGALLLLTRDLSDPAQIPASVAAAGAAGALALLAVTVDETDEAFANIYSSAVSVQNLLPRAPQRLLIVLVAATATIAAIAIDLVRYEDFLLLLGSCFVPLFGVLLTDWLLAGRYSEADIFRAPALRAGPLAAWAAGFAFYQWLEPVGPSWWVELMDNTHPPGLGIGATLPSLGLAIVLTGVLGLARRRGLNEVVTSAR
jgi:nucleobase:cation symporter-1, NCS1 family